LLPIVLLLHSTLVDAATDEALQSQGTPDAGAQVEEVIVEAPEPRYVAPTLRDRIGRIWAPVLINGQGPFRLVLDTGASNSAVVSRVADSLGIPLHGSTNVRVHGVTGSAVVSSIDVDRLEVGDLLIDGTRLPVVADVFGGADGVLGTEGLADKRIFIDFRGDRIQISRSRNERAGAGFSRIPLTLSRGRLLTLNVRIGSIVTKAIIDTGAQQTIGNTALREALLRRAREVQQQDIIGVTLDVATGDSIRTPPIYFGGLAVRGLYVTFADMFIFEHWRLTSEPTLLIGMDVLGLLDTLIIDYKMRELSIRVSGSAETRDSREIK
jgi:predicted aspartyl protease